MKIKVHEEITREAVGKEFSTLALDQVIAANTGQDAIKYQIGHDHFHYDNNSFSVADEYCDRLREMTIAEIRLGNFESARASFGKMTHTLQDFFAHSNYIELCQQKYPNNTPEQIDINDLELLNSDKLISGKLYYPIEAITFIPFIPKWVISLFPADSHARMNKDSALSKGYRFAYCAAVKRTKGEFEKLKATTNPEQFILFCGF